jgi:hypothetical protein
MVEALGFILDIGPNFWLYFITKGKSKSDIAWTDATSFLDVSGDILVLVDGIMGVRPKTGMHHSQYLRHSPYCHQAVAFPVYNLDRALAA